MKLRILVVSIIVTNFIGFIHTPIAGTFDKTNSIPQCYFNIILRMLVSTLLSHILHFRRAATHNQARHHYNHHDCSCLFHLVPLCRATTLLYIDKIHIRTPKKQPYPSRYLTSGHVQSPFKNHILSPACLVYQFENLIQLLLFFLFRCSFYSLSYTASKVPF